MLRSARPLRRGALLIRGPLLRQLGPGSAVHRDRTMLRIAGRTLHPVRDSYRLYRSRVTVEGSPAPFSSISAAAFGIASIPSMPRGGHILAIPPDSVASSPTAQIP